MTKDLLDLVGSVLDAQFRVDALVDEGELSFTYKGHDLKADRLVAIRCLNVPTTLDPSLADPFVESFQERTRVHLRIAPGCSSFVQTVASGTTVARTTRQTVPYEVREWLEGSTLAAYATKSRAEKPGAWPIDLVLTLLAPVATGLAYLHARGLVHGEVNPNNLLVLEGGESGAPTVKLLDVGEGRTVNEKKEERPVLRVLMPEYTAPEQVDKLVGTIGAWTDVFSLAVIVLECLAGGLGTQGVAAIVLIDPQNRPSPKKLGLSLPRGVEDVLDRALSLEPDRRPADAAIFWSELREALTAPVRPPDSAGAALPPPPPKKKAGTSGGKRTLVGLQPGAGDTAPKLASVAPLPPVRFPAEETPTRQLVQALPPLDENADPTIAEKREPVRADNPLAHTDPPPSAAEPSLFMPALGRAPPAFRLRVAASRGRKVVGESWVRVRTWTGGKAWPWLVARASDKAPRARAMFAASVFVAVLAVILVVKVAISSAHKTTEADSLASDSASGSLGAPASAATLASGLAPAETAPEPATTAPAAASSEPAAIELPQQAPAAPADVVPVFNRAAAIAALDEARGDLTECKGLGTLRGYGSLRVTFDRSGVVTRIHIGPPYADTPEGACVLDRFGRAQMAQFRGPPSTLNYTFVIPQ